MANTKAEIQQIPWKVTLKHCTQFHPTQVYICVSLNRSSNTNQGSMSYQYLTEKMEEIEQTFVNNMCSIISEWNVVNNNLLVCRKPHIMYRWVCKRVHELGFPIISRPIFM